MKCENPRSLFSGALGHAGLMEDAHTGGGVRGHVVGSGSSPEFQQPTPPSGGGERGDRGDEAQAGSGNRADVMDTRRRPQVRCSSAPERVAEQQQQQQWWCTSHDQEARAAEPQVNQRHISEVPEFFMREPRVLSFFFSFLL